MNQVKLPLDGTLTKDIVCFHNRDKNHDSPFHQHSDHYELYLFVGGDATFYTKSAAYPLVPGDLIAIPNGHWHRAVTTSSAFYERVFLNINVNLVNRLSSSKTDLSKCFYLFKDQEVSIRKLTDEQLTTYLALIHKLIASLEGDAYGSDLNQRILITQILLLTNTVDQVKQAPTNIIPSQLSQIIEFIDTHLRNDLSLAVLSKYFYVSPTYLNRFFKSYMGLSLHRYITEKRLTLAKELLTKGKSVTDVCNTCGFGNYSNFIRAFTRYVGVSPGKFKKRQFTGDNH